MSQSRTILGIDPGTQKTGYGIIRKTGNTLELVAYGVIFLGKHSEDHAIRLKKLFQRITSLVIEFRPDEVAIEAPFFGKNVQSMLKLGRAQGVAIAAVVLQDLDVTEYAPRKVKMAVTGNGNASKEQVSGMLVQLLHLKEAIKENDATDGLAVALCHSFQRMGSKNGKSYKNWASFVKDNPGKVSSD